MKVKFNEGAAMRVEYVRIKAWEFFVFYEHGYYNLWVRYEGYGIMSHLVGVDSLSEVEDLLNDGSYLQPALDDYYDSYVRADEEFRRTI